MGANPAPAIEEGEVHGPGVGEENVRTSADAGADLGSKRRGGGMECVILSFVVGVMVRKEGEVMF